jgi:hypothetical protein
MGHSLVATTILYDYGDPEDLRPALSNLRL